ncbi:MAG TPA: DUF4105 domain-containing protein [Pirellulales bacterium]|jgi:hypothetical protein|nr:DUF4105 domain-containing protein [Pirellulales bacterium]
MPFSGSPISGRSVGLWRAPALLAFGLLTIVAGCQNMRASRPTDWTPDHAVLAHADFDANRVTVHNVRNCVYRTADDYTPQYYDRTYDLEQIASVDFVVVPFADFAGGAHTFLSFGFDDRQYVAVSAEMRKRRRDIFPSLRAGLPLRPLIYVIGDEHDLIGMRTNLRKNDVYVYRLRTNREQARVMFCDVLERANTLISRPEYYNVVTNNCNTNALRHVNRVAARPVPYTWQVLLPGYSDRLVYQMGLLDTDTSFEQTRQRAKVTELAHRYGSSPDFSALIRR